MTIDDHLLLKVQYAWVADILKRMEEILMSSDSDESKVQQVTYLVKQGLKAEKRDND